MKCGLCGNEFDENQALCACKSCPMMKGCKLIKCPRCGFEMPPTPKMPKWLNFSKKRRKDETD